MVTILWIVAVTCLGSGVPMLAGIGIHHWWTSMSKQEQETFLRAMSINFMAR